ncbi:hypothetical protein GCM10010517_51620 [Streptosporangium fragile]|uniref:Uncharacterized protein n=1 Tax=Streptosporangium fragile TaxID=46186 RepID=A0ABP6IIM1_9ACTN
MSGPDGGLDQAGARPVVELPIGDAGRGARRRAPVADVGGHFHRSPVEQQTLFTRALTCRLAPFRVILIGVSTLAAADRHADLRLSLIPRPDLGVYTRPQVSLAP